MVRGYFLQKLKLIFRNRLMFTLEIARPSINITFLKLCREATMTLPVSPVNLTSPHALVNIKI